MLGGIEKITPSAGRLKFLPGRPSATRPGYIPAMYLYCFYIPACVYTLSIDVLDKVCICIVVLVITNCIITNHFRFRKQGFGGHVGGKQNHKCAGMDRMYGVVRNGRIFNIYIC